eukprot:105991-Pleurochrysis_carterae.AAC.1
MARRPLDPGGEGMRRRTACRPSGARPRGNGRAADGDGAGTFRGVRGEHAVRAVRRSGERWGGRVQHGDPWPLRGVPAQAGGTPEGRRRRSAPAGGDYRGL